MSGVTGYCVVCGDFHATGHMEKEPYHWIRSSVETCEMPIGLFLCAKCAPFFPELKFHKCPCCDGEYAVAEWPHKEQKVGVCRRCFKVRQEMMRENRDDVRREKVRSFYDADKARMDHAEKLKKERNSK